MSIDSAGSSGRTLSGGFSAEGGSYADRFGFVFSRTRFSVDFFAGGFVVCSRFGSGLAFVSDCFFGGIIGSGPAAEDESAGTWGSCFRWSGAFDYGGGSGRGGAREDNDCDALRGGNG